MKRKIITDITYLKQKSIAIEMSNVEKYLDAKKSLDEVIKNLEDSLDPKRGIGLTAIQIGIPLQVAIIRIPNKEPINLYNSKIIEKSDLFKMAERCLSLLGIEVLTKRYKNILWENGDGQRYSSDGIEAVCIQHEIDHFNGILIIDRKWKKRR